MSRCFFHQHAPPGLRDCEGPIQLHHQIKQQRIRSLMAPRRMHLLLDSELREIKGRMARALRDPRNLVPACKRHHDLWHASRIRVAREDVPPELEAFAAEYGLVWDLDRQFGPLEQVA